MQKIRLIYHCFGNITDLKIPQSDWSRAFDPYLRNYIFPKNLCRNIASNINFYY